MDILQVYERAGESKRFGEDYGDDGREAVRDPEMIYRRLEGEMKVK